MSGVNLNKSKIPEVFNSISDEIVLEASSQIEPKIGSKVVIYHDLADHADCILMKRMQKNTTCVFIFI